MTKHEPNEFWEHVPPKIKPSYHFYNVPVDKNSTGTNSPTRMIKQISRKGDFVAYKLDIDNPSVEIPIALDLLRNKATSELVHEFFFELHFRCQVLANAWAIHKIPEEINGLKTDRHSALIFFQKLREAGVRAHFWP